MEVDGENGFAQESGEGAVVVLDPGGDVIEAVVALGDDKEEPEGKHVSGREGALPVQGGWEMAIERGWQLQALQDGPEDGEVAYDFDTQQAGVVGVHPFRLQGPTIRETGQNTSEP